MYRCIIKNRKIFFTEIQITKLGGRNYEESYEKSYEKNYRVFVFVYFVYAVYGSPAYDFAASGAGGTRSAKVQPRLAQDKHVARGR
jgi:hypothetical protein